MSAVETESDLVLQIQMAKKALKAKKAQSNLLDFIEYMKPSKKDAFDYDLSEYRAAPHHKFMIDLFTKTTVGGGLRTALSIPPQHGKTTVFGQYGLAWLAGNNPEMQIIFGTYSDSRASKVGESVRTIMMDERFLDVFPDFELRKGSKSKDFVGFGKEGSIMFLGRNSGASGNPCHLFIIDDPFKDRREARSLAIREEVWDWYNSVVEARCPWLTPIVIIHTRWSDDDLIGRLCDPANAFYIQGDGDNYEYVNIPAIVHDPALAFAMGLQPGDALWAEDNGQPKFPLSDLHRKQKLNPVAFAALYMGQPIPPDGEYFKKEMIKGYKRHELPKNLKIYGASDHAISTASRADHSVLGLCGIDSKGDIWVLHDLVWDKMDINKQVEEMIRLINKHSPLVWFSEGDHIKKSINPFLKVRLRAAKIFKTNFKELSKVGEKTEKAQAIYGQMALGMVHLPEDAPWYTRAITQILNFSGQEGRPDDFVDFLACLGRGLEHMFRAQMETVEEEKIPATGTAGWVKMAYREERRLSKEAKVLSGW